MTYHLRGIRHRITLLSNSRKPARPPATPVINNPTTFGNQDPINRAIIGGMSDTSAKTRSHSMPKTNTKYATRGERLIQLMNHILNPFFQMTDQITSEFVTY